MATTFNSATALPVGSWAVDPDHSTVEFRVKHVGLARVRGVFHRFDGVLDVRQDGTVDARGTVDADSLDTRVGARDAHQRSADFFDVDHHPTITFAATAIEPAGDDRLRITG